MVGTSKLRREEVLLCRCIAGKINSVLDRFLKISLACLEELFLFRIDVAKDVDGLLDAGRLRLR